MTARVSAAADVGSTSAHLLVASLEARDVRPLADESVFLHLGAVVDERGTLGEEATAELVASLRAFAERARTLGAPGLTAVGTEPLRRALDAARAVRAIERDLGLPLHVISHDEEALLTLVGVTAGRPVTGELAVVDVGGGSTELIVVGADRPATVAGFRLGAARLTARFALEDPPTGASLEAMRGEARARIAAAPETRPSELVAVGGTADNLLKILPAAMLDRTLTPERIREALAILAREPAEAVAARYGLRPLRARLLPAGAAILAAVLERYGVERLPVSGAGMRDGLAIVSARAGRAWRDRLGTLSLGWPESAPPE